ncbi:hypothetical protein D3C75_624440 [compost metagenome]
MRFLQDIRQGFTVNRCDNNGVHAFGDHIFNLRYLVLHDILRILQVRPVPEILEFLNHIVAVVHPAFRGLRRHGDAHLALRPFGTAAGAVPAVIAACG